MNTTPLRLVTGALVALTAVFSLESAHAGEPYAVENPDVRVFRLGVGVVRNRDGSLTVKNSPFGQPEQLEEFGETASTGAFISQWASDYSMATRDSYFDRYFGVQVRALFASGGMSYAEALREYTESHRDRADLVIVGRTKTRQLGSVVFARFADDARKKIAAMEADLNGAERFVELYGTHCLETAHYGYRMGVSFSSTQAIANRLSTCNAAANAAAGFAGLGGSLDWSSAEGQRVQSLSSSVSASGSFYAGNVVFGPTGQGGAASSSFIIASLVDFANALHALKEADPTKRISYKPTIYEFSLLSWRDVLPASDFPRIRRGLDQAALPIGEPRGPSLLISRGPDSVNSLASKNFAFDKLPGGSQPTVVSSGGEPRQVQWDFLCTGAGNFDLYVDYGYIGERRPVSMTLNGAASGLVSNNGVVTYTYMNRPTVEISPGVVSAERIYLGEFSLNDGENQLIFTAEGGRHLPYILGIHLYRKP